MSPEGRLGAHLENWLGAWPPPGPGLHLVGSHRRVEPGWDGSVQPVAGVLTPDGGVLSVPPGALAASLATGNPTEWDAIVAALPAILRRPEWTVSTGVFRWSTEPTASDDPGHWIPTDDRRAPEWLQPFNGEVLVALVDDEVVAGVGRKQHDPFGHELAVVTEESHRGHGWARRLVTQAARRVLDDGAVPTYLHATANTASARTADAAGFPDRGWHVIGMFPGARG